MMQLASWLADPLLHDRDFVRAHPADWALVRTAALRLDRHIATTYGVVPVIVDDAASFRRMVEDETERCRTDGLASWDLPLLGAHVDPLRRRLDAANFLALCAVVVGRPMSLLATQTGAFYRLDARAPTLRTLLETQRLWCDFPERDAPYDGVLAVGDDLAFDLAPYALIHAGTAWVHPERQGRGLGRAMVRLQTLLCRLRFGRHLIFGTVAAGQGLERIMGGRDAGTVIQTRQGVAEETRLLVHEDTAILDDAMKALRTPPPLPAPPPRAAAE